MYTIGCGFQQARCDKPRFTWKYGYLLRVCEEPQSGVQATNRCGHRSHEQHALSVDSHLGKTSQEPNCETTAYPAQARSLYAVVVCYLNEWAGCGSDASWCSLTVYNSGCGWSTLDHCRKIRSELFLNSCNCRKSSNMLCVR
jgi:hypothetical protein